RHLALPVSRHRGLQHRGKQQGAAQCVARRAGAARFRDGASGRRSGVAVSRWAMLLLVCAAPALAQEEVSRSDRLLHEQMLVLDTHLDTPMNLERPGWVFGDYHHYDWDVSQI